MNRYNFNHKIIQINTNYTKIIYYFNIFKNSIKKKIKNPYILLKVPIKKLEGYRLILM